MGQEADHGGDDESVASAEILPIVYGELRKLAQFRLNKEAPQTLSATALVHEAYLRVSKGEVEDSTGRWKNKRHFFGAAAEAMRRILIEGARSRKQLRRGGHLQKTQFQESQVIAGGADDDELLAVDEALVALEASDPETAELIKMRYFAGMTWPEVTEATGIAERTLYRRWSYAKAWLKKKIGS